METIKLHLEQADNGWIIRDADEEHVEVVDNSYTSIQMRLGDILHRFIYEAMNAECMNKVCVKIDIDEI